MKRFINSFITCLVAIATVCGCNDLNEVNERLNDLQSRVTALETLISSLNGNVEALQALAGGGTIKSVEQQGDTYTIVTSNGTILTIKQGSIGVGNAPLMSIDEDGYWMADYQDGKGPQYVLSNGEKVMAIGQNGITPKFGVDSENYWTVSYDGGATFTRVLNADGQPVKAIPEGEVKDSYFKDVKLDGNLLVLTLANDDVYSVPVISDFYCIIDNEEEVVEFNYDEVKAFDVDMKGVASALVTAPDGWNASLSESKLKITAPSEPTKAALVIADSNTDVSILVLSASGYSAIATVRVKVSGAPSHIVPVATVKGSDVTVSSVSFTVEVEDATEWYSQIIPASAAVPTVVDLMTKGTKHTEAKATVTFDGVNESSTYYCYVLPVNGEIFGSIVSAMVTSAAFPNRYDAYMDGKNIVLGGVIYNKTTHGEPVHLTADITPETNSDFSGIYFADAGVTINVPGNLRPKKDVVIIGSIPGSPANLVINNATIMPQADNMSIIFSGLNITTNKNALTYAARPVEKIGFYNCKMTVSANYFSYSATSKISNTEVSGCDIKTTVADIGLFDGSKNGGVKIQTIIFNNNVVYSDGSVRGFRLMRQGRGSIVDLVGKCEIKNNTFYNISFTNGLFTPAGVDAFYLENNIFAYVNADSAYQRCLWISSDDANTGKTAPVTGYPAEGKVMNNIRYNTQRVLGCMYPNERLADKSWYPDGYKEIVDAAENPFSTADATAGTFTKKADFASYGAQR